MQFGPDMETLHRVLLESYSQDTLRQLVRFRLDVNTDDFIGPAAAMEDFVYRLLRWAESENRTGELIAAVKEDQPQNTAIQELRAPRRKHWAMIRNDYSNLDAIVGELNESIRGLRRDSERMQAEMQDLKRTLDLMDKKIEEVNVKARQRQPVTGIIIAAAAVEILLSLYLFAEIAVWLK